MNSRVYRIWVIPAGSVTPATEPLLYDRVQRCFETSDKKAANWLAEELRREGHGVKVASGIVDLKLMRESFEEEIIKNLIALRARLRNTISDLTEEIEGEELDELELIKKDPERSLPRCAGAFRGDSFKESNLVP